MFVDACGKFLTQRPSESRQGNAGNGCPAMAAIRASYMFQNGTLTTLLRMTAPGQDDLDIVHQHSPASARRRKCTLFSGEAHVVDQDASAGEWFAQYSGIEGVCLVKSDERANTAREDWRESRVAFQSAAFPGEADLPREVPLDDGGTILLTTHASIGELNSRLAKQVSEYSSQCVDSNRCSNGNVRAELIFCFVPVGPSPP
jgi:hypothetical protein